MGHERLGLLPKTKKWRDLVQQIGSFDSSNARASDIATQILQNVIQRYAALYRDRPVHMAFEFLVTFSTAFRHPNPSEYLCEKNIKIPKDASLLPIIQAIREHVGRNEAQTEHGYFAVAAATDALSQWHQKNRTLQIGLFEPSNKFIESWKKIGNGAGFCELSQLFFGNLTERYLNYFLDREASAVIYSVETRNRLKCEIRKYAQDVSRYAFETARITKSFSAGWFNKNTKEKFLTTSAINSFLGVAFGKMRSELHLDSQSSQR